MLQHEFFNGKIDIKKARQQDRPGLKKHKTIVPEDAIIANHHLPRSIKTITLFTLLVFLKSNLS